MTVDVRAGGLKGGHETHSGPVWNPTLKAAHLHWGDIIPAFSYKEHSFEGMNLTEAGQLILSNGCSVQPVVVTPRAPTATIPTCATPTMTVTLPTGPEGVIYPPSGPLTLAPTESVTITPTAAEGYVLAEGSGPVTITNTFDPSVCTDDVLVTPLAPTTTTATCTVADITVTLPSGPEGVRYEASGSLTLGFQATVTVTAFADEGFVLPEQEGGWTWTFTNEFDPATCTGALTVVKPADPTVSKATCVKQKVTVTLPSPDGVVYTASGSLKLAPGKSVTITPTAAEGFVLAEGSGPVTIKNAFDTTTCSGVLPEGPINQPATPPALAATGSHLVRNQLAWALTLLLAGSGLTLAARRPRATS
jgi:hypothetical protein